MPSQGGSSRDVGECICVWQTLAQLVDDRDNVYLSWSLFFSADMVTIVYIISLACDWLAHSN